jgi:amino acid adenylation domain-containing protein/non-ribosomal peptide synthase protein (TIGR01720 family)
MNKRDITEQMMKLTPEMRARLFQQLREQPSQAQSQNKKTPPLSLLSRDAHFFPLSFAQQRLWFLNHFELNSPLYNVPVAFRLHGVLHVTALREALEAMVERHESLRTSFHSIDGAPVQVIADDEPLPFVWRDLRTLPAREREKEALQIAAEEATQPFDLTHSPLMRIVLLQMDEAEHVFLLTMHHIIVDGWSTDIFMRELALLYEAFSSGKPSSLPELPIQYLDYAVWQRAWLQGEELEKQLSYWKQQLANLTMLQLPLDHPRPTVQTHRGSVQSLMLSEKLVGSLHALSQQEGCTLFMTLMAAFQALLSYYTGQEDIPVGTMIANRNQAEIEGLIGFFVNTVVLRTDLSQNPTFQELLGRVREVAFSAYEHQDIPFEKLVDELQPDRALSHTPLFQVMFILQNTAQSAMKLADLTVDPMETHVGLAKFDLTLEAVEKGQEISLDLIYNADVFDAPTVTSLLGHFQTFLETITRHPSLRLSELPLLTEVEQRQLLNTWNTDYKAFPEYVCIQEVFESQVTLTPAAVAVVFEEQQMSYLALNRRANQVAHHLRARGVGPDVLVGLCMERSIEMVIGMLAILKAGGTYVPLDPDYPLDRLAFIEQDAQISVILTEERLVEKLSRHKATIICLDTHEQEIARESQENPRSCGSAEHRAYVIYTSGSTGKPKGVQISHRSVVSFLYAINKHLRFTSNERLLAITTLSFDIAGLEIYLPLITGACLVLVGRDVTTDGEQLQERLIRYAITAMQATPATWRLLVDSGWKGNKLLKILCGGEALSSDQASQLLTKGMGLWNLYGPTEATIWSTVANIESVERFVPLGRPLANTQVYLLDKHLRPVPVGVPGELHIGGEGLSQGYLYQPELTAEKFIPHPFSKEPGARLYKTGDLVRTLSNGALDFLGRIDHQVKVRGFRIELGEIEAALGEHPAIQENVVIAWEAAAGEKRLVAYLVPYNGTAPSLQELRSFLKEKLPEYMVPSNFITLDALPLTPNRKIDRRALPEPSPSRPALTETFIAPRTLKEEVFAKVWSQVLGIEQVGVYDNFFELGGDSLLAIRVVARLGQAGYRVSTRQLFQHQTVADLAAITDRGSFVAEQQPTTGRIPFSPSQRWFLEMDVPKPHYHSIVMQLEARNDLNPTLMENVAQQLFMYHDVLRLRLVREFNEWRLICDEPHKHEKIFSLLDFSSLPEAELSQAIRAVVTKLQTGFDIAEGPLFKLVMIDPGHQKRKYLMVACHYMPADLESWHILLGDIESAYDQACRGEPIHFPPKTTSFKAWIERLTEYAQSVEIQQEQGYWLSELRYLVPRLPVDYGDGANTIGSRSVVAEQLGVEETRNLYRNVLKRSNTQIDSLLLTSLTQAFAPWIGRPLLLFNLVGHGRVPLFDDMDLSHTMGWLNTMSPVLIDLRAANTLMDALKSVNEQLRTIPRQGIGYGLLRYLSQDRQTVEKLRAMPPAEVYFNFIGVRSLEFSHTKLVGTFGGYHNDLEATRPQVVGIESAITEGQLILKWEYSQNIHHRSTIEKLARKTMEVLRSFIAQSAPEEPYGEVVCKPNNV